MELPSAVRSDDGFRERLTRLQVLKQGIRMDSKLGADPDRRTVLTLAAGLTGLSLTHAFAAEPDAAQLGSKETSMNQITFSKTEPPA